MQLAAAAALGDLRPLVLGDHPLELPQQLILRRAGALRLLREHHLDTGALELFEQQHLIGVAAREPIRRVTQQHLEAALDSQVAQPLQRRAAQHRTRDALVLEDQIVRDQQPALGCELTQRGGLALRSSARDAADPRTPARRSQPLRPDRSVTSTLPLLLSLTVAPLAVGHTAPLGRQDHIRLRQPRIGEAVTDELDLNAPCHRAARRPARDTHRPPPPSPRSTTRHRTAHARAVQRSTTAPTAP